MPEKKRGSHEHDDKAIKRVCVRPEPPIQRPFKRPKTEQFVPESVGKPCCAEYHEAVQVFKERECDRRWHLFQMGYV